MNMRRTFLSVAAIGMLLAVCGTAFAETRTISWSPVTAYTDGTPITGTTVSYSVYWSTASGLSGTMTPIATGVSLTYSTFDPAAEGMTAGQTAYFRVKTSLGNGSESGYSDAFAWTVPQTAPPSSPTLASVSVSGSASVNEGGTATYGAAATWTDGSTSSVTPTWSVSGGYATISSAGVLTAGSVTSNRSVTVTATYQSGGVTRTATKSVTIVNVSAALSSISIAGPATVSEGANGVYTAAATWNDGSTSAVSPSWSVSGRYATINNGGVLTARTVSSDQTVTVTASYGSAGVTRTATKTVRIVDAAPTLAAIAINGPASVNMNGSATYTVVATWSDGTNGAVSTTWSVSGTGATISASGLLTAAAVGADQTVTVNASSVGGGNTRTATRSVTIAYVTPDSPASPGGLLLDGPVTSSSSAPRSGGAQTWRLAWDRVTMYADGTPLPAGTTVRYAAYWSQDASLADNSLVPLGSPVTATSVDFAPQSDDMANYQRVYFAVRATLDTGAASALSDALPWRVSNKGPAAPTRGKIVRRH
jgi:hypothetical protein